jgi:hypothetical protein
MLEETEIANKIGQNCDLEASAESNQIADASNQVADVAASGSAKGNFLVVIVSLGVLTVDISLLRSILAENRSRNVVKEQTGSKIRID